MSKRKVRLKRKSKLVFLLILLIGVIGFGGIYHISYFSNVKNKKVELSNDKKDKKVSKKEPKEYTTNLFMVGDALIHYGVYNDAKQKDGSYDFRNMFEYIKPIASKYDLAYYNQETILGGASLGYSSYPRFNSPQEVGDAFIDAGFNMVSLATNHTMDKNEQGVINSVNYWKTKKDRVVYSGQWISAEEREIETSQVYEKNGIKYAFLSYTTWTNGLETPVNKEYLNNVYSPEKAAADIAKVKDKADVIIVAMHWGTEYSLGVDVHQDEIANYLSNLGVHIIIGAHPHVVEPVEYLNNGKTFVIYSLGNFISDQGVTERLIGLMMEVTIRKKVDTLDNVTISIESPKAQLIYTKDKKDFKVIPFSKLNDSILPNYMKLYEKYKGVVNTFYPNLTWGLTYE